MNIYGFNRVYFTEQKFVLNLILLTMHGFKLLIREIDFKIYFK